MSAGVVRSRVRVVWRFVVGGGVLLCSHVAIAEPSTVESGGIPEVAEQYPEQIPINPGDDRERFAESSEDNWGIPEALELYQRSEQLYDEGRYQESVAFLLRVIEIDPTAPELYYNTALVYEHLQEYDRALEYLERYSRLSVDADERRRVERMMNRIRGAREHLPPSPRPQSRTRVVVQRFGRADGLFWGMIGATILFTSVSAITGGLALDWGNSVEQFTLGPDGDLGDYGRWVNTANSLALTTDILIGVASATALTALLLYVLRTHPAIEVREEIVEVQPLATSSNPETLPVSDDIGDGEDEDEGERTPDRGDDEEEEPDVLGTSVSSAGERLAYAPWVGFGVGAVILEWKF